MKKVLTADNGRTVVVDAIPERLLPHAQRDLTKVWQPTEIYDTQLGGAEMVINVPVEKLLLKAERVVERRLLKWMTWSGLMIIILLLLH